MTTVREMTPDDVEAVLALHADAARAFGPRAYDDEQVAAWADKPDGVEPYVEALADEGSDQFVAECDGAVVGWGQLDHERADDAGEVTAVYVDPAHARTGVGSALLTRLEDRARERGLRRLSLHASLNAVGFYERHGYRRQRRSTHETTGGVELPVVVMARELPPVDERAGESAGAAGRE